MIMAKSRTFALELYPEDNTHVEKLEYIKKYFDYAYILHDKDKWEEDTEEHKAGEIKKPHWHVIIAFKNARSVDSIKKELELAHVETCNFYAYTRYLIHKDQHQKYQYSEFDILTNMELRVMNALKRDYNSREQDTRILLDYIFSRQASILSFKQLTEYAMQNDCLLHLQKNVYFYKQFCDDFGYRRI